MTWTKLLQDNRAEHHSTSKAEIDAMRELVALSETEADDIVRDAQRFAKDVERWIAVNHPGLR